MTGMRGLPRPIESASARDGGSGIQIAARKLRAPRRKTVRHSRLSAAGRTRNRDVKTRKETRHAHPETRARATARSLVTRRR